MTKIAVIGTGAMGSVYAGLLADAGHEVWAIDRWREHVDAISRNGLRVEGASGDRVATLRASVDAAEVGACDLVILATKAADVGAAAHSAKGLMGPNTLVLAIQNGLGSTAKAVEILGPNQVIIGVVGGFGASIVAPGHVHHNGWELLHLGELQGPATSRLRDVAEVWRTAGFHVKTYDDAQRMVWEKFICNVCYSGVCTLTGMTIGEVIADPEAWGVAAGCATEAWQVARALNIDVAIGDPVAHVLAFGAKIPAARPSMLLDHMAKRRSEVDVINGAVPAQATLVGLSAPYNEVVSSLVHSRERHFETPE